MASNLVIDNSDLESLEFILVDVCKIDQSKATEITKYCCSVGDMLNKINLPNLNLSVNEKTKIIQFGNLQRRCKIDIEEATQILGDDLSMESTIEYALSENKYDSELNMRKKELYEMYQEDFIKIYEFEYKKRMTITQYSKYLNSGNNSLIYLVKEILPKIVKATSNYPMVYKGVLNCLDETIAFITQYDYFEANIISGQLIFGIMSTISLGKNLYKFWNKEITFKDCLCFTVTEMAVHGATVATTTTFAVVGGLIGSFIPIIGTAIGSLTGSLCGMMVSAKIIEPALISQLQKNLVIKDLDREIDLKMYKESLVKFNIGEDATVRTIKDLRRIYNRENHPDKNISNQMVLDQKSEKFIEMETHFRIIEAFRKANNTWE